MAFILTSMVLILLMAGAVALFVAFPRRGREVPHAAWAGDALQRAVDRLPTLRG